MMPNWIVRRSLRNMVMGSSYDRYKVPFIGSTFRGLDQYADYNKMYADYMRNVGREIKYPSIRDPRANAGTSFSNAVTPGLRMAGKTFRWFI